MDHPFNDSRPTYLLIPAIVQDLNRLLHIPTERREAALANQRLVAQYGSLSAARHAARQRAIAAFPSLSSADNPDSSSEFEVGSIPESEGLDQHSVPIPFTLEHELCLRIGRNVTTLLSRYLPAQSLDHYFPYFRYINFFFPLKYHTYHWRDSFQWGFSRLVG